MGLVRKALWTLSNIASDSAENIELLVKSEAFALCLPIGLQSNDILSRMNAVYIIVNFIVLGPG